MNVHWQWKSDWQLGCELEAPWAALTARPAGRAGQSGLPKGDTRSSPLMANAAVPFAQQHQAGQLADRGPAEQLEVADGERHGDGLL